jgi:hypothetical protein
MAELPLQLGHTTLFVRVIESRFTWRYFVRTQNGSTAGIRTRVLQCASFEVIRVNLPCPGALIAGTCGISMFFN